MSQAVTNVEMTTVFPSNPPGKPLFPSSPSDSRPTILLAAVASRPSLLPSTAPLPRSALSADQYALMIYLSTSDDEFQ